jgi:prepilin peptidase CpaA
MILDAARLLLFPALVAFAATSDLLTMRISNWVSLTLVTGFLVMAPMSGMSLHDILMHFAAGAIVLAVAFACFAIGQVGGADAKVAAAVALWFGFDHLMNFLIDVSLLGGALTILLLLFRSWPLPPFLARQDWLDQLHKKQRVPYGIALALGALIVYPETEWIKAIDLTQIAMR